MAADLLNFSSSQADLKEAGAAVAIFASPVNLSVEQQTWNISPDLSVRTVKLWLFSKPDSQNKCNATGRPGKSRLNAQAPSLTASYCHLRSTG
jgi:hypothetical protein